ncbi:MAG: polysaccharide export protein, partial [Cyanobacteria bacterium J069]
MPEPGLQPLMPLVPSQPPTGTAFTLQQPLPPAASRETYILGAGDAIRIDIFDVPEFSGQNGQYTILSDGSLNLPWVGNVSVQNMTLAQAASALAQRYARYIDDPLITVTLLAPRPMRIGIIGQVNRPGIYTVNPATGATSQKQTVSTAIQAAGGITQLANVRGIEVRRPTASGEQSITVDLWRFLQAGDIAQDIALQDGDTVIIPEASSVDPAEAAQIAAASFSPATINVNVVGEVMRPGTLALPPNVSLNQ